MLYTVRVCIFVHNDLRKLLAKVTKVTLVLSKVPVLLSCVLGLMQVEWIVHIPQKSFLFCVDTKENKGISDIN